MRQHGLSAALLTLTQVQQVLILANRERSDTAKVHADMGRKMHIPEKKAHSVLDAIQTRVDFDSFVRFTCRYYPDENNFLKQIGFAHFQKSRLMLDGMVIEDLLGPIIEAWEQGKPPPDRGAEEDLPPVSLVFQQTAYESFKHRLSADQRERIERGFLSLDVAAQIDRDVLALWRGAGWSAAQYRKP